LKGESKEKGIRKVRVLGKEKRGNRERKTVEGRPENGSAGVVAAAIRVHCFVE